MRAAHRRRGRIAWQPGPAVVKVGLGLILATGVCTAVAASTSSADSSFNNGTADAGSVAFDVAPTTGGLNYAAYFGAAATDYENQEGEALAQSIDLGLIASAVLEAPNCATG